MISIHRVLEHRARAVVALLALALAACALTACGGGGGGGGNSSDAQALLKETFTGAHKIKSGKANLQLSVNVQADNFPLRGPIKVGVTGPFQSAGAGKLPQFALALTIGVQSQTLQAGLTSTSGRLFVNFGGTSYEVPASLVSQLAQRMAKAQQQTSASKGKLDLAGLGIDPLSWLNGATVEGKETVGGVETEHITAQLNVDALLNDVDKLLAKLGAQRLGAAAGRIPKSIPANVRQQIKDAVKGATVDVWTGVNDKTLRKLALALSIKPKSGKLKSADVAFGIELSDLNAPQTIPAPTSVRPLSELLGQFQGLLGGSGLPGLGGASSGGSGSGGSGNGASTEQVDKYAQCLKDAGTDVQKAQGCASLLTK